MTSVLKPTGHKKVQENMQNLNELLAGIEATKTFDEQKEVLDKFFDLNDEQIKQLISLIHQEEAGFTLKYIGFPKLEKFIPELLTVLKNLNSPSSWHVAELIVSSAHIVFAEVKKILESNESSFKSNILMIIQNWDKETLLKLKDIFLKIACSWNDDKLDALRLLVDKKLIDKTELQDLVINNEAILTTCISLFEDDYNWENLDYLSDTIIEVKDKIGRRLNHYLLINLNGIAFYSNDSFSKSKNLLNRFLVKLDKYNLDKENLIELAGVWGHESTLNLGNESITSLKLLADKKIATNEEIKAIIHDNKNTYNKIKNICDLHIKQLEKLEEKIDSSI